MIKFLEIKTIHENIVLINIEQINTIQEGIDVNNNFIWLTNGQNIKTFESIEEIKSKLC